MAGNWPWNPLGVFGDTPTDQSIPPSTDPDPPSTDSHTSSTNPHTPSTDPHTTSSIAGSATNVLVSGQTATPTSPSTHIPGASSLGTDSVALPTSSSRTQGTAAGASPPSTYLGSSTTQAQSTAAQTAVPSSEAANSPSKPRINVGAVVGITMGGIAVAAILLILYFCRRKRSTPRRHTTEFVVDDDQSSSAPSTDRMPLLIDRALIKKRHREQSQSHSDSPQSTNVQPSIINANLLSTTSPRMESSHGLQAGDEIAELRGHMLLMQEQIESLQRQGPSNEPPPEYTSPDRA